MDKKHTYKCRHTHVHTSRNPIGIQNRKLYEKNTTTTTKTSKNDGSFCVSHLLSTQCQLLRMACVPSETVGENLFFPFLSSYQLEPASGLGLGTCIHFPSRCQDRLLFRPSTEHAATLCEFLRIPVLLCLRSFVFFVSSIPLAYAIFPSSLSYGSLKHKGNDLMDTSH